MSAHWWLNPLLCIDTETTGVDVFSDSTRIVEVAVVAVDADGAPSQEWTAVIDPGVEVPAEAARIHGITTSRAMAEGIPPAAALSIVRDRIYEHAAHYNGDAAVVIYNATFDWPLLLLEAERHGIDLPIFAPILDPLLLDRMLSVRPGKRNLQAVAKHYGVSLAEEDAHGALADATATGRVMRKILAAYPQISDRSLGWLYLRQVRGHYEDRNRFADWMRQNRDPNFEPDPPGWPIPAKPLPKLAVVR